MLMIYMAVDVLQNDASRQKNGFIVMGECVSSLSRDILTFDVRSINHLIY